MVCLAAPLECPFLAESELPSSFSLLREHRIVMQMAEEDLEEDQWQ